MSESGQKPSWTQKTPFTDEQILWFLDDNIADSLAGSHMKGHAQYIARFALEQIRAVRCFAKSSTRLTWALIIMTGILIVLTSVLTYFTIVLAGRC
jgi:hypothetical protein